MIRTSKATFYKETIEKYKNDPRELVKCSKDLRVKNVNQKIKFDIKTLILKM